MNHSKKIPEEGKQIASGYNSKYYNTSTLALTILFIVHEIILYLGTCKRIPLLRFHQALDVSISSPAKNGITCVST